MQAIEFYSYATEGLIKIPPNYEDWYSKPIKVILLREESITHTKTTERSDDEALWDAVQANQAYKAQHPDEELEQYQSGADFLKAVEDL